MTVGSVGPSVLPSGTVTFLLTDVEGSTEAWQRNPDVMVGAMARHAVLLGAAVEARHGVRPLEQGEGDSVVAAFALASDALLAALEAQRSLMAEQWPLSTPLRVRMAVHTGEAIVVGGASYAGQAIIRTARLRALAHGGQVLVSAATRDLVVDELGDRVELIDLGSHRLKDLVRPEHVWQLRHPELIESFPPLRSLDARANNLPVQLSDFIGRDEEIAAVRRFVGVNRLVTLLGVGGAGKSRLAQHVAADVLEDFPDGAWWVELAAVATGDGIARAVASALAPLGSGPAASLDEIALAVRGKQALVVLDNCEHLVDAAAAFVHELLVRCPMLTVMTTSRAALDVAGELAWRVPPLSLPPEHGASLGVDDLERFDAARLFVERARRVRPNFRVDKDDSAVIAAICLRLDGMPLAIELAAARCRTLVPAQILSGLDDAIGLLVGGGRTSLPRQQTLEASLRWSHELLSEPERVLLRRLSVFVNGWTLDAAEAVAPDGTLLSASATFDVLDRLVDQSLVNVEDHAHGRYRLLETVRQFAAQQAEQAGETESCVERHTAYFAAWAREQGFASWGREADAALSRLDDDLDNVRAAFERLDAEGRHETLALAVGAMDLYWQQRSQLREGLRWAKIVLTAAPPISDWARLLVLRARSSIAWFRAAYDKGSVDAEEYLRLARASEIPQLIGDALSRRGFLVVHQDPRQARPLLEEALEQLGQPAGAWGAPAEVAEQFRLSCLADTLITLATVGRATADPTLLADAVDRHRQVAAFGIPFYWGWQLLGQAYLARLKGDFPAARSAARDARELADRLRDDTFGDLAEVVLVDVAADTAEPDAILDGVDARVSRLFEQGNFNTWGILNAARLRCRCAAEPAASVDLAAEVEGFLDVVLAAGVSWMPLEQMPWVIALHESLGDDATAVRRLDDGRRLEALVGNPSIAALLGLRAASLAWTHGDPERSAQLAHEALNIQADRTDRCGLVHSLELLAALAASDERWLDAARMAGAAGSIRDELGYRFQMLIDSSRLDDGLDAARVAVGNDALDAAAQEGHGLAFEDAIAFAQRPWGLRRRPNHGWASLTPTERQVVALVVEGCTNPQIAARLLIGRETVKSHLAAVFTKLGVKRRAELAALAAREEHR